jgi:PAS domain S-box-containing protein
MPTPLLQHYKYLLDTRDSGPDQKIMVLILDPSGRFMCWNRAAEVLTGYSEAEMLGHVFWETLLFQEDIEPVKRKFEKMMSGEFPGPLECRWKSHAGTARWMACTNFERCVSPGGMECLAFTADDVTESRHSPDWRTPLFAKFIEAREAERFEISRFIHDTVAQNLVALAFSLDQRQMDPAAHDPALALDLVDRCCRDIRLLGYMLAPAKLGDDAGLEEGIESHARTLRESGALDIEFHAELASENLSGEARAVLFSAVHEFTAKAITNRANKPLAIVLKRDGPAALLEIKGAFDARSVGDRDYPVIRERVGALGGYLEMMQDCVRIALPMALAATAR